MSALWARLRAALAGGWRWFAAGAAVTLTALLGVVWLLRRRQPAPAPPVPPEALEVKRQAEETAEAHERVLSQEEVEALRAAEVSRADALAKEVAVETARAQGPGAIVDDPEELNAFLHDAGRAARDP